MARRRIRSEVRETRDDAIERVTRKLSGKRASKDVRWYTLDDPHAEVFDFDERVGRLTQNRRSNDLYHACLYDDAEMSTLFSGLTAQGEFTPQTMTTNIVKRQIDTYVERQEKNQPVPMVMAIDATYDQAERAKDLTKLFAGVLDQVEYHATLTARRRDRAVWGTGIAHNYRVGRKLFHERAFPWEFRVDPREALHGKPRTLIRRHWIDRRVLAERFPDHREAILADEYQPSDGSEIFKFDLDDTCDLVFVIEIWHLPSSPESGDGAHAICISEATLSNREYKRDYFPFSVTHFTEPLAGFWGEGLASLLKGLQFEVNSIGLRMQEQGWLTGTYVWAPGGDDVALSQIDNGTLTQIQSEVKPEFLTPAPWHPSVFDYYMFLRGRAPSEESRLSEMSTRGELPAGLESGKAIRSWNQLDDQAYLSHGKKDERDCVNTSWQLYDLCEEIYEEEKLAKKKPEKAFTVDIETNDDGRSLAKRLDYAAVRIDRANFKLRAFPTSLISGTPAEQMQQAEEIAAKGLISRDAVMSLLRIPDVERVLRLETAPRRAIEKILSKIIRSPNPEAAYVYPEPAFGLELCRALGLMYYLDGITEEARPANLRWVLQFALDAEEQIEAAEEEAAAGAMGGAMPDPNAAEGVDPAAMGQDPSLFAPSPEQLLPQGAATPEAMPLSPGI